MPSARNVVTVNTLDTSNIALVLRPIDCTAQAGRVWGPTLTLSDTLMSEMQFFLVLHNISCSIFNIFAMFFLSLWNFIPIFCSFFKAFLTLKLLTTIAFKTFLKCCSRKFLEQIKSEKSLWLFHPLPRSIPTIFLTFRISRLCCAGRRLLTQLVPATGRPPC